MFTVEFTTIENTIRVYPNPAGNFVVVESSVDSELTYSLFSVDGVTIHTGRMQGRTVLTTDTLPSGLYIISIKDNIANEILRYKLNVIH